MASIISKETIESHTVGKYNFKVISMGKVSEDNQVENNLDEEKAPQKITDVDSSALSNSSKESLIESLMQKTDEMSSNFIKLQMKLESKEEEHEKELVKIKEDAFAEGIEAGIAKAMSDADAQLSSSADMFSASVVKLDESAKEFEVALEAIKSDLINAALDIASEVVKVELSHDSNAIAKVLSEELLNDLQGASQVTLKVNPKNHGELSSSVGKLEHVSVLSDPAVSEGGVIVVSDAGNIDSQLSKRFQRVKRAALGE